MPPTVPTGTGSDVLLFQINSSSPSTYSNSYAYWWQAGGTVSSGAGKRAAYDTTKISEIKFVMSGGSEARYSLGKCDTMVNIMSAFGLSPSSTNNNSNTWKTGHGSFPLISTTDTGYFQTQAVTIGQGDGSSDSKDWVVFGFDSNPASDWNGDSAIGCENMWSICGGKSTAKIYGKTCGGAPAPTPSPVPQPTPSPVWDGKTCPAGYISQADTEYVGNDIGNCGAYSTLATAGAACTANAACQGFSIL